MKAGALDRQVDLLRATSVKDATGGEARTWLPIATDIFASREDVRDSERVQAAQVGASLTTRFRMHWSLDWADLDVRDRIACEGRVYDIVAVKEIGRREGLEVSALARAERYP